MHNMKTIHILSTIVAVASIASAATFEDIKFNTPILSSEDPLGVSAITNAQNNIVTMQGSIQQVDEKATLAGNAAQAASQTAQAAQNKADQVELTVANTVQSGLLTNDTVVVGNYVGDAGVMKAGPTSMVFAVARDIDEMTTANGEILFASDRLRFDVQMGAIWFGDKTFSQILSEAGQGEVNVINTVKVNGTALVPDADRAVDITIPDAGQSNVIETVKVNGVALVPDSDKVVDITIPTPGESNVVVTVKVNGTALTPDADRAVDVTIPTTFTTSAITDLDFYKNPTISVAAQTAIDGINNAQDIATIKSTLTNFLNQFVIPAP